MDTPGFTLIPTQRLVSPVTHHQHLVPTTLPRTRPTFGLRLGLPQTECMLALPVILYLPVFISLSPSGLYLQLPVSLSIIFQTCKRMICFIKSLFTVTNWYVCVGVVQLT